MPESLTRFGTAGSNISFYSLVGSASGGGGGTGTVTSVAISGSSAFAIIGSPITTSGTIVISGAGTSLQYIDGTGSLQTFPSFTGYVSASTTLTINGVAQNLSANRTWSIASGGTAGQLLSKNTSTDYDYTWIDNYTELLFDTVKANEPITKGQAIYISGANGTNQLAALADNSTEATSSKTLGLALQTMATNAFGQIVTQGLIAGLNTATAVAGDPVWLGTSGNLLFGLANKPVAPAHLVYIGVVTRAHAINGEIYVRPQNGFELQELHNVLITGVTNNDILAYESATSLWKNKPISGVLGYVPQAQLSGTGVVKSTAGTISYISGTSSQYIAGDGSLISFPSIPTVGTWGALNYPTWTTGTPFVKMTAAGTFALDTTTYLSAITSSQIITALGYTPISGISSSDVITALGYTPVTNACTLTINGTAYDLSANRSWTVGDVLTSGSYANPSWISSLSWSKIISTPTTLAGYGIIDAVPSGRTLTINGTTYDLSANRTWTVSGGMTNPMTTLGDIIYEDATPTAARLAGNTTTTQKFLGQVGNGTISAAPTWFDLFGTANTWTALQTIQSNVSAGTFSALLVKNTSATSTQFVDIQLQTGTGYSGGLKGFNDGSTGLFGSTLQLYSSKGITFSASGRTGAGTAGTDATFAWVDTNISTSNAVLSLITNTSNPRTQLQIYNPNAGSSYIELTLNVNSVISRIKGYAAGYGALAYNATDILRWDDTWTYIGDSASTYNETKLRGLAGFASQTTISSTGAATQVLITNSGGLVFSWNSSTNNNYYYPFLTLANKNLGGYVATVPEWQLRMFSNNSGSSGGRLVEITTPSSTTFTASQVVERWDIFATNSYLFKQHYIRTSIDTAALSPASALLHLGAATSSIASLNIKSSSGTAPSSPADGDIWYDGTNIKIRVGATTKTFTIT